MPIQPVYSKQKKLVPTGFILLYMCVIYIVQWKLSKYNLK